MTELMQKCRRQPERHQIKYPNHAIHFQILHLGEFTQHMFQAVGSLLSAAARYWLSHSKVNHKANMSALHVLLECCAASADVRTLESQRGVSHESQMSPKFGMKKEWKSYTEGMKVNGCICCDGPRILRERNETIWTHICSCFVKVQYFFSGLSSISIKTLAVHAFCLGVYFILPL